MSAYTLPDLPYDYAALEPHYSAKIVELHHDKHHAAYVKGANDTLDKLAAARESGDFGTINQLEKNLAFHVSGHILHSLFWTNLTPDGGGKPEGELAAAIDDGFGSFDAFKSQLTQASTTVQGSGWGALAWEPLGGRLVVEQIYDHQGNVGSRLDPAVRDRRVGARVLPAVPQRQGCLRRRRVGDRQLGRCRRALRRSSRRAHQAVGAAASPSRGMLSTNVAPPPGVWRAATVPPWASMMDAVIDSPSPDPPRSRVRALSAR